MAKKTRRSFSSSGSEISETPAGFNPDYTYVVSNLKRIGVLAVIFIGALIVKFVDRKSVV